MILDILRYPDPRLSMRCETVGSETLLDQLVADMLATVDHHDAAGLAAPQVGALLRVFVLSKDVCPEQQVFVNPVWSGHETTFTFEEEGCLSFPGFPMKKRRFSKVIVAAQTLARDTFRLELDGLAAVAVQHETDHLDGRLMIDGALSRYERRKLVARLRVTVERRRSQRSGG